MKSHKHQLNNKTQSIELSLARSLLDMQNDAMLLMDNLGHVIEANTAMSAFLALEQHEMLRQHANKVLPTTLSDIISTSQSSCNKITLGGRQVEVQQNPLRDKHGVNLGLLLCLKPVINSALKDLQSRASRVANIAANNAVFATDLHGQVLYSNDIFTVQTGYSAAQITGKNISCLKNDDNESALYQEMWRCITKQQIWRGEVQNKKKSGRVYWSELTITPLLDENKETEFYVGSMLDITTKKEQAITASYHANYDKATGFSNAILAKDRLEGMVGRAQRHQLIAAVIYLDISCIDEMRQLHGEHVAQQLLQQYGQRVQDTLRSEDAIARMSNHCLAVLLPDLVNLDALEVVSAKLDSLNQQTFVIDKQTIHLEIRQGLAAYPQQGLDAQSLLNNAQASLLEAWQTGQVIGGFELSRNEHSQQNYHLRRQVQDLVRKSEFTVVYQPIIDAVTDEIVAMETLTQWHHQQYGLIDDQQLNGIAEAADCIELLGINMLHQVCQDYLSWQEQGYTPFKLAINLCHGQLRNPKIVQKIIDVLASYQLPCEILQVEITLSHLSNQWLALERVFSAFALAGIALSYDEFGERGAYISDLEHFPFAGLKLSATYIAGMNQSPGAANLVEGIIALARSLNLQVTAVGVSELSQMLQLQEMGCHFAQGELFNGYAQRDVISEYLNEKKEFNQTRS